MEEGRGTLVTCKKRVAMSENTTVQDFTGCVEKSVSTSFAEPVEEVQRLSVLPGAVSIRSIMIEQASALEY